MQVIDKFRKTDHIFREKCIKALRKLAQEADVLPSTLAIEEVILSSDFPIAGGAFSDVFQGKWRDKLVAVKRPRIFKQDDENAIMQARREILLWRQLHDQNILPLLGVFDEGRPFYSMVSEWMPNGTLGAFLKKEEHRKLNRTSLAHQVSKGLKFLHTHKPPVTHGDIKASNIFVDAEERPLLGDFGLVCYDWSIERTLSFHKEGGTIGWMAPELLESSGSERFGISTDTKRTPATDVYAFAMTMLEIFTDKLPYEEDPDLLVLKKIEEEKLPDRPGDQITERGLTDSVWKLMNQCWSRHPASRPKIDYIEGFMNCPRNSSRLRGMCARYV
ncbi:kinase-like protein [Ramaria rubella]|nr:kinase-like protein [Ramaria rubella]